MARMIDADTLKKEWSMGDKCEDCPQNTRRCQYDVDFSRMDICQMIDDAPTVGGWISVDDRLPNSNGCYIVWRPHFYPDYGMPAICYFDGTDTWHDSYGVDFSRILCSNDITHWMPLPEPPEVE